jgi:hypothetical protein
MKRALAIGTNVSAAWAATGADGAGPSPGVDFGRHGITAPGGQVRHLTVPAGRGTVVETVRLRGGRVVRSRYLRGAFGIPLVAYDGTTGGLARNGRRLVLASPSSQQVAAVSRFIVLDPRTLRVRSRLLLHGTWAFDALSPGGSLMYLIQYLGEPSTERYAVRAFNLNTRTLYPGAIVDRREPAEKMNGLPVTRVESRDGTWAYTLYMRSDKGPFVHALDTSRRRAFCVDLPWSRSPDWLWRVRLHLAAGKLELRRGQRTIASVDTKTFEASRS